MTFETRTFKAILLTERQKPKFWRKKMSNINGKGTAVVTGASSGIGAVYADRLAKRGYDLILVARNGDRLQALSTRLAAETGRTVEPIKADLSDKIDLARIEARLKSDQAITLLVNNAGVGATAPLLGSDVEKMDEMIRLNVGALTRLTYAAAPGFVQRGGGTIINIASIVAITPETLNGVYGATKAFVLALSHSLQHELSAKGVRVQAVLPGATATDFWDAAGRPVHHLPKEIVMTAEDMVDAALVGLDQGEIVTIPPLADETEWNRFEASRRAMIGRLSSAVPASRYSIAHRQSA
jgi:short-subunit dehydrogenase